MDEQPVSSPASNVPEYSVSEISGAVKRTLEGAFGRIRVRGEITELKRYPSGHIYFSLKDEGGKIAGVVWKFSVPRLGLVPENGVEVIAQGKISSYGERSSYQLIVDRMEYAGAGALLARIEALRLRLAEEGLFAAERKRALPLLPEVIGVITSPQGAVIQDIKTTLARRFPRRVVLWPVPVQGEGAAERIAMAIEGFSRLKPGGAVPRPDEKKFITVMIRTNTPKYPGVDDPRPEKLNPLHPTPQQIADDERRAAKFRELVTLWVKKTGHKVLIAPETIKEMGHNKRLIHDPLPPEIQKHVVNLECFWNADEAASIFARAHTVVCHEPHSPIIALANGTPIIHTYSEFHSPKCWMFKDIGLPEWLLEMDETPVGKIAETLFAIDADYPAAQAKVKKAMSYVHECFAGSTKHFQKLIME